MSSGVYVCQTALLSGYNQAIKASLLLIGFQKVVLDSLRILLQNYQNFLIIKRHAALQVAVLAKQCLDKDLTDRKKTAEVDLSPLVGGSYQGLANFELQRRVKQVSTAFYGVPPKRLFDMHGSAEFAAWAY